MPQLLTTNALITCPHGGVGTTIVSTPILSASGGAVAVEGDTGVLSCVFVPPCVGYTLQSMGLNATTVLERKAILTTDLQRSMTGMPLSIVETHSVLDDSTTASLPSDGSTPAVEPFLLDVTPPLVQAVPPVAAFNTLTMLPPVLPIVFTLSAAFPMSFELRLLNGVTQTSIDLTSSVLEPVVAPSGGAWDAPVTVVTVTLTATFFVSLGPGAHFLYMTGTTRRGISAYTVVPITVT